MKKSYDHAMIEACMSRTKYAFVLQELREHLFVAQYEKGEFVTSPLQRESLFQIVVQGSLNIYFIRDDGSVHALSEGRENCLLGEMELFSRQMGNVYAEAREALTCLALPMEQNREALLGNNRFLRLLCESLTGKMQLVTAMDAAPAGLRQRVLTYMRYKCAGGELKGLQQAAFHLNCSARQLQRILNQYEADGAVVKTGKGAYRLTKTEGRDEPGTGKTGHSSEGREEEFYHER